MPTYNFRHKETQEIVELRMKISERTEWLENNPEWESVLLSAPKLSSGNVSALQKAGDGWKEVQQRIKSGLPPKLKDNIRTK